MQVKSVRQESILKQFYIYFLVAAVIPFIALVYVLFQLSASANLSALAFNYRFLLFISAGCAALGFWGTRSFLAKIVALSNRLKNRSLANLDKIDRNTITELAQGDEEVAHLAKAFNEIISDLENNIAELKETKRTLYQVLSNIGNSVGSTENFDLLLHFILETIINALGAKRGAIFFLDKERQVLKLKAAKGIDDPEVPQEIKIGQEAAGWVVKENKPLLVPALEARQGDSLFSSPLIASPLVVHENVLGAINLSGRKEGQSFSEEDLRILSNLACQIAVSVENFNLNAEVEKIYFETISALALAVEAKDLYSRGHSERVAKYAVKMAEYLALPAEDLKTLRDAARLHDIGKIGITDEILHKPTKLDSKEKAIMHKHPEIGEGIVKPLRNFRHIIDPILHHHEFLDGSGYPGGLKEGAISLITRILTISDIFDAMVTDRPYRKALSIDEAKKELDFMAKQGKIDGAVLGVLFKLIEENKLN